MKRKLCILLLFFVLLTAITACGDGAAASADQQELPSVDAKASADSLIGSWVEISADGRFANISRDGEGYLYEDNEGKYPATFQDGVLKVKVSESDLAEVYIDPKNGHMLSIYQGYAAEFEKK